MTRAIGLDRDRLGKLLGLLGSDHDGEVAAAGRMADALVRGAGLTWPAIVAAPVILDHAATLAEVIDAAYAWPEAITEWEWQFLRSVERRGRAPSPKQQAVIDRIAAAIERYIARAGL
ncbi:MAG TPA: hypothetical protein VGF07_11235 [Stellaceae bacterium]